MTTKGKSLVIGALVVVALVVVAFVYYTPPVAAPSPETPSAATTTPAASPSTTPTSTTPKPTSTKPVPVPQPPMPIQDTITMAEVSAHASASSCWTIVRGNVYDLTSFVSKHPGGKSAITKLCGKDGTEEFVDQHGGSAPQESTLASFKIGVIEQ